MKNKLTKHHHKRNFYLKRNIIIAVSIILLAATAIAVPVSIVAYQSNQIHQLAK